MIERFDPTASRDNEAHRKFAEDHRERYRQVAACIASAYQNCQPHNLRIVDAACGAGYGYEYLSPVGRYVGLDRDPETIAECKRRYPEGDFRVADLSTYDAFRDLGRIDAIVSLETAEHLPGPINLLMAAHMHLRETNGLLCFSAPTCLTRDFDPYHIWDRSADEWASLLRRSGFHVVSAGTTGFTVPFRSFLGTVPTTLRQKFSVLAFWLRHPCYVWPRLREWGLRGRFRWESTLWVCRVAG